MLGISFLAPLAISALCFTSGSAGQGQNTDGDCKCLYGEICWPSESDFAELSSQLSQPLIHPVPSASACYSAESPSVDCAVVQANFRNYTWRADHADTYQNVNFERYIFSNGSISACYLNATLGFPCDQGSIPPIGVDARNAGDVQVAVRFAVEKNLKLVIKNTGHDFLGRSSGRNGFMIWTHHMKNVVYNETFAPEGAPETEIYQALTVGAGVQWREAYAAAQQNNRFIVGGISGDGSVGAAGGWIGGGGHSPSAPRYGLGVDNAVQFTVVTANGDHIIANPYSHPELFWALRGGGPGTYGVVTSVTYKTHPVEPVVVGFVTANFTSTKVAKSVGTELLKLQPRLSDAQWSGGMHYTRTSLAYTLCAPNATMDQVNVVIGPFLEHLNRTAGENNTQVSIFPVLSFQDAIDRKAARLGFLAGGNGELASRLYTRNLYETEPEKMVEAFLKMPGGSVVFAQVAGGVVSQIDPDSAGLNPAWRGTLGPVITSVQWEEGASATEIQVQRDALKQAIDILEELEPGTGSYVNEGSLYEPNPKWTYFGDHYDKLLEIKDQYDPNGLFVVASGVGSDRWDDGLNCRRGQ
ncbi:hypothetical protein PQX77_008003 [Marasmius sp. AFHP31]|nr:hypothetical protein PQX77_008003 [Marasmius sp. AFHP31]